MEKIMPPIATIKQLNVGTTGLDITGQVNQPSQMTTGTTKDGRPWSRQWMLVQDQSDKIGVTLWNSRSVQVGETVHITGKLEANNKGEIGFSGKLAGSGPSFESPPQAPQAAQAAPQGPNPPQYNKDQSIERQVAWKGACAYCGVVGLEPEKIPLIAMAGAYFIVTGKDIYDIPKPAPEITEGQGDPEDDIPF